MRYLKDTGFIIKRTNLFDSDKYITIFTKDNGKIELLAKGVRKINSRRSSHVELLNLVQFQAVKTRNNNYILSDIQVIDPFSYLKEEYSKVGAIFLMCELVDKLCPFGIKHEDIFSLVEKTAATLKTEDIPSAMFSFQVDILTMLGFWDPNKKFKNTWEIDRFMEDVVEKKIRAKLFLKL